MDEIKTVKPHSLIIENRKKLSITGVSDVGSFDEENLFVITGSGDLMIRGENLQVTRLDLDSGEISVEGEIDSLNYSDLPKKNKKGFFKGL